MKKNHIAAISRMHIGKAIFHLIKLLLYSFYYSVLTAYVIFFIAITILFIHYVFSQAQLNTASQQFSGVFYILSGYLENTLGMTFYFEGQFSEQDLRRFIIQASSVFAIFVTLVAAIKRSIFKQKKAVNEYIDNKKWYLFFAGLTTIFASATIVAIMVREVATEQQDTIFITVSFLVSSYIALFIFRQLNRVIDSIDEVIKMAQPAFQSIKTEKATEVQSMATTKNLADAMKSLPSKDEQSEVDKKSANSRS